MLPILLLAAAIASFTVSDRRGEETPTAVATTDVVEVTTPMLSARRVPGYLSLPQAQSDLDVGMRDIAARSPQLSCLIVHDTEGVELFTSNPDVGLVPASVQKLVTATAALEQMGPDARYRTVLAAGAASVDGIIEGDLYLIGGGDPLLHTEAYAASFPEDFTHTRFEQLADDLVASGVIQITGGVIADETRYDIEREPSAWAESEGLARDGFTGPLSALMLNDGFSSFPEIREPGVFPTPASDPALFAAQEFDDLLEERGVVILGGSRNEPEPPPGLVELVALESAPMSEIVAEMLTFSDNTTAELLLKEIGLATSGEGSTDGGGLAALEILGNLAVDIATVRVADGSGLSDRNRLSCDAVIDMLEIAGADSPLANGLAIAGASGTLRERFTRFPLRNQVRAKTGTLSTATALAGFVETRFDATLVFAYLANLEPEITEDLLALQEPMLERMADYPDGPPPEELEPLGLDEEPAAPYLAPEAPTGEAPADPGPTPTPDDGSGLGPDE
ncbi:MAG: D-alanyl-D-alanine carboxypeptidase/D-alanyl-D-alanine-endopeptidase [Acidimicrobiia bacterium]|nr:D-alanyl-D-alanine carboxypeptidase/D-alanyl-D-alanine-endopeptidase [Acidimicrobiia bacterium]